MVIERNFIERKNAKNTKGNINLRMFSYYIQEVKKPVCLILIILSCN